MEDAEKAWLAGYIDGDGCITASISQGNIRLMVSITSKSEVLMKRTQELFPAQESYLVRGSYSNEKRYYMWKMVGHKEVGKLLRLIEPFFISKRPQAQLMLQLIEKRKRAIHCAPEERPYNQEELKLLEQIFMLNSGRIPVWLQRRLKT